MFLVSISIQILNCSLILSNYILRAVIWLIYKI